MAVAFAERDLSAPNRRHLVHDIRRLVPHCAPDDGGLFRDSRPSPADVSSVLDRGLRRAGLA
jgi:hypothetical protein